MKIFTNDTPFELVANIQRGNVKENQYVLGNASVDQILKHYELICGDRIKGRHAHFIFGTHDYDATIEQFKARFQLIDAAGGIVEKGGKILFIKRLGKWDLPKGKVEKGESLEEAALREVEEECSVKVALKEKIGVTWHTYIRHNQHVLKCTHWYHMQLLDEQQMAPQHEEGIEEVCWIDKKEVAQKALGNTYRSICEIYQQYEAI